MLGVHFFFQVTTVFNPEASAVKGCKGFSEGELDMLGKNLPEVPVNRKDECQGSDRTLHAHSGAPLKANTCSQQRRFRFFAAQAHLLGPALPVCLFGG